MAQHDVILPTEAIDELPRVRTIGAADLRDALAKGFDDFLAMPTHVLFLCLIYPVVGVVIGFATTGYELVPLLYPIASGFALLGPFAAIGLYELSRRREAGLDTSWKHAIDIIHSPSLGAILALGLLLLAIFVIWVFAANAIYAANFGTAAPTSLTGFASALLTTPEGRNLIIFGNIVGVLFSVLAFSLSVVAFPLLLDRHVGFSAAVVTSIQAVARNPKTMALWGLIVAAGLMIGALPLFIGLAVVMPVLGHSTWHLYRRVIEQDGRPHPEFQPRPKGKRYAADFPTSLFSRSKREE